MNQQNQSAQLRAEYHGAHAAVQHTAVAQRQMNLPRAGKRHHPVRTTILAILLLAIVAAGTYAYLLNRSMNTVRDDMKTMSVDYKTLTTQILSNDATGASATAQSISATVTKVQTETDSWVWRVAANAPVFGQDVKIMQSLVGVADDLASKVAVPVTKQYSVLLEDGVIGADGSIDASAVVLKAGEVSALVTTLTNAKQVVAQADQTVNGLGASHFQELNDGVASAREGVDSLNKTFEAIDPVLTSANQLANDVTALVQKMSSWGISL